MLSNSSFSFCQNTTTFQDTVGIPVLFHRQTGELDQGATRLPLLKVSIVTKERQMEDSLALSVSFFFGLHGL
jgi:hypothetical protein